MICENGGLVRYLKDGSIENLLGPEWDLFYSQSVEKRRGPSVSR
jgi:hypothetical protein